MNISSKITIFISICVLSIASAKSLAEEKDYTIISGLATLSCGSILEDSKNKVRGAEISDWLNGYVTGYNFYNTNRQVNPPDRATNIAFIENFCRNNPLSILVSGGAVLVQDLGGPKVDFDYK
jgi:hypothetical protein